jgi:hypothetical protein
VTDFCSPHSSARKEKLRRPESQAVLENGIKSARSISSSVSWVSSALSSGSESSSAELGYHSLPRPVSVIPSGPPPVPAQGTLDHLTAENLARLNELPAPAAVRTPVRGRRR